MLKFDNIHQKMDRKGLYPIDDVLPFIVKSKRSEGAKRCYDGDMIKMSSDRYKVFNNSTECKCGVVGVIFSKERDMLSKSINGSFHFNLYGIDDDGQAVLMTKDHIIPKSRGGEDSVSNYETMCYPCNQKKGVKYE